MQHYIRKDMTGRLRNVPTPFNSAMTRLHLESYIQFWVPHSQAKRSGQSGQGYIDQMALGLQHSTHNERLRELGLHILVKKMQQQPITMVKNCYKDEELNSSHWRQIVKKKKKT